MVESASSTMCSWVIVWKPGAATRTLYSPAGRGESTYNPATVVGRDVCTPVATLTAVTVACGMMAPDESVIVPWMVPLPAIWALPMPAVCKQMAEQTSHLERPWILLFPPSATTGPPILARRMHSLTLFVCATPHNP